LGWPQQTGELKTFYPTDVLVTGFDIIFFWVARMIMMGLKFMDDVPFHEVYIHGLVRDAHGQKMSKSKGNVLDPLDLIDGIDLDELVSKRTSGLMQPHLKEKIDKLTRKEFPDGIPAFGTDALRLTFAMLAATGRDINFDMGRIEGYRNFCNKLWNAARYVFMNTEGQDCGVDNDDVELSLADRWIMSRLQQVEKQINDAVQQYRFDHMAQAIYDFTWNEYCDWYLELSKTVLNNEASTEQQLRGTRRTLVRVLETLLRLAHPLMPYITEEIWQKAAPLAGISGDTIMLQPYPEADSDRIDEQAIRQMNWIMQAILGVRKIRGEMDIKPGQPLPLLVQNWNAEEKQLAAANQRYLMTLARLDSITWLEPSADAPESATALAGNASLLIPMAGLIDKDAESARLNKEIEKITKDSERTRGKLANASFVDKAPAAVVQKEKDKLAEQEAALEKLRAQLARIQSL
jgi:valyl-tRNA synthetase